uniref:T-complex protein 11-like protein 1 n=1 Tax=Panagrellus redivivus TaxID=6233 RepID=A0A7E4ZRY3_PANRE
MPAGDQSDKPSEPGSGNGSQAPGATPTQPINIGSSSGSAPTSSTPPGLPSWIAGASPVKFFTLDELLTVNSSLEKMIIAHEIAVDPNFSLDSLPKDPLEEQVKRCVHDAFWDQLKEDFAKSPPVYKQALTLVADLRAMILGLLNDQQKNLRRLIEDGLDPGLIENQVSKGAFGLKALLEFVMDVLGKLCAPARDEALVKLRAETDTIATFRGIFEFVELMKLDLANYNVSLNRSTIEQYAAEYEREEFFKVLQIDPMGDANLRNVLNEQLLEYIAKHPEVKTQEELTHAQVKELITNMYMTLLETPPVGFPETVKVDERRIQALSEKYLQLVITVATIFVTSNLVGKAVCEAADFKTELKKDLIAVSNDIAIFNVNEVIDNMAIQCAVVSERLCGPERWNPELAEVIKGQVGSLKDPQNAVRKIAHDRIHSFLANIVATGGSGPVQLPPGLSTVTQELGAVAGRYLRLTSHNWRGFGSHYAKILETAFHHAKNSSES